MYTHTLAIYSDDEDEYEDKDDLYVENGSGKTHRS